MEIYVGFSRSNSNLALGSIIISKSENRPYSHCYIKYICPISNETMVFQASKGLVNEMNYIIFKENNIIVKEYKLNIDEIKFKTFYKFLKQNLGKKYSKSQIVWLALKKILQIKVWSKQVYNIIKNGNVEYICSEIAAIVCFMVEDKLKQDLNSLQIDQFTPSDMDSVLSKNNVELTYYNN